VEVASVRFENIREYEGSRSAAWEELSFILAHDLDRLPGHVRLDRRGTPDGGVEFTCSAPSGRKGTWGWQAKYLFKFNSSTFGQMRGSFKEALKNHPDMSRYAFVLPANPPDGAVGVSGFKKWMEFKDECEGYARDQGVEVELVLHVRSDVFKALLDEKHAGVVLYFFDARFPTSQALARQVSQAVGNLGDRYDADLHVETEFPALVEALCLDDVFVGVVVKAAREAAATTRESAEALSVALARSAREGDPLEHEPPSAGQRDPSYTVLADILQGVQAAAEQLSAALQAHLPDFEFRRVNALDPLGTVLDECGAQLANAGRELRDVAPRAGVVRDTGDGAPLDERGKKPSDRLPHRELEAALGAIAAAGRLLSSQRGSAARRGALLVVGEAGCGKSHTIADIVSARVAHGAPTVLILGNHLRSGSSLGEELGSVLNLGTSWSDLLAGLQTAAQVRGHGLALVAIDAINEGAGADLWRDRLAGLLTEIDHYPMVSILLSVRDTYERSIITSAASGRSVRIMHPGLAGHEHEAVAIYASHYGLSVPALPPLVPEFTNPLVLRTMCRAASQRGLTSLPLVAMGDDWVFGGLMDAVNAGVSAAKVLDRDEDERVAQRGAKALAELMVDAGRETVSVGKAGDLCRSIVDDGGSASRSLLGALEREGILIRQPGPRIRAAAGPGGSSGSRGDHVRFTYQRMSDHLRARVLLDRHRSAGTLATALTAHIADRQWAFTGVLEALAALTPGQFGVELPDLVADQPWSRHAQYDLGMGLLASLQRRPPDTITARTVTLVESFVTDGVLDDTEWLEVLITLACVPGHPLNIDFLDQRLRDQALIERDRTWTATVSSVWVTDGNALARTIDWLWGAGRDLSPEAARMAAMLMAWLLTSTSRRLRDSATKVLVEIADGRTALLAQLVDDFVDVNDSYVRERLLAVVLGHLARMSPARLGRSVEAAIVDLCDASVRLASRSRPNVAVTHFVDQILHQVALRLPDADLPSYDQGLTEWPLEVPTIADLADRLDGRRGKHLLGSPVGHDFGTYILERGTCRDFVPPDQEKLRRRRRRNATARYKRTVAKLADATGQSTEQIEEILADRTSRMSLREFRSVARDRSTTADARDAEDESADAEEADLESRDYRDIVADMLAMYRDQPRTQLQEIRDAYPGLTRAAEQAAQEISTRDPVRLDADDLERWIVDRVLDLGWLPESNGGPYDRPWEYSLSGAVQDKIERIGKKYAWVAHQELLAVLAEHCLRQRWDGELVRDGSIWELVHVFDIDPTTTVRADVPPPDSVSGRLVARARRIDTSTWWSDGWGSPMSAPTPTDETWLRTDLDVPDPQRLMVRVDPRGEDWVILESHVAWEVDRPNGLPGRAPHRRDMWIRTQSYLTAVESIDAIRSWSAGQDWMGLWMPTPPDYGLGYLRDYPHGEPWASWYRQSRTEHATSFDGDEESRWSGVEARFSPDGGWDIPTDHDYPSHPLALATYGSNASPDADMSSKSGPRCLLPSPLLVSLLGASPTPVGTPDLLGLGPVERQYRWSDSHGVVMFCTDGWRAGAPWALLVRGATLTAALARAGLTWWTWILGEKISWEQGDPTRERLNMFGAGGLGDDGWELWSFDMQFHDYDSR
jgi:hypothetical protein